MRGDLQTERPVWAAQQCFTFAEGGAQISANDLFPSGQDAPALQSILSRLGETQAVPVLWSEAAIEE